ncbi:redoxin family protein [Aquisediminimonas profunda]|uniref:redoxin family protein n=1 Tax=Aquisediminimonas profunda TaxID=1550733 RepID=UPI001C629E0F|nr:redoxin family protein [Aquisediminimonas profunda]
MSGFLFVSQALLWVGLAIVGLLVAALARQVGVLHERIAPAGALTLHKNIEPGHVAPQLRLSALDGSEVVVGGEHAQSQLLFFVSPDCPVCKSLLPTFKSAMRAERAWLRTVLASDGDEPSHRKMIAAHELEGIPYVVSEELGRAFGVSRLPYAVLIDEHGKVAALGLVNSREHLESLFEAKERGVASLQQFLSAA